MRFSVEAGCRSWFAHGQGISSSPGSAPYSRIIFGTGWLRYWALPVTAAVATTADAFAEDFLPAPDESWSHRLSRMMSASRNANTPMSHHKLQRDKAATRGRNDKRRGDDAAGANDDLS